MSLRVDPKHINTAMTTDAELTAGLALKYDASNPSGFETPLQLNTRDTNNRARGNHTGTQLASTISDWAASVRGTILSGLDTSVNAVISATDHILGALGKLQKQVSDNLVAFNNHVALTQKVKLASNATTTSNTVFTNVTGMQVPVVSGKTYRFHGFINFSSTATNSGANIGLNGTAAGTLVGKVEMPISATAGTANKFSGPITTLGGSVTGTGVGVAGTQYSAEVTGTFICTTSGNIYPIFRSETSGQTTTIHTGSNIVVEEI